MKKGEKVEASIHTFQSKDTLAHKGGLKRYFESILLGFEKELADNKFATGSKEEVNLSLGRVYIKEFIKNLPQIPPNKIEERRRELETDLVRLNLISPQIVLSDEFIYPSSTPKPEETE